MTKNRGLLDVPYKSETECLIEGALRAIRNGDDLRSATWRLADALGMLTEQTGEFKEGYGPVTGRGFRICKANNNQSE